MGFAQKTILHALLFVTLGVAAHFIFQDSFSRPKNNMGRSPASVARLNEADFKDKPAKELLLWLRLDYRRNKNKKEFGIDAHVVASNELKQARFPSISNGSARFISVPIVDKSGTVIETLEIEKQMNPEFLLAQKGEKAKAASFEDGNVHSYTLRIPVMKNDELFKTVLADALSNRAEMLVALVRLESIYLEPAIVEVLKSESSAKMSEFETALIKTSVNARITAYFNQKLVLDRLQEETSSAKAKIAAETGVAFHPKKIPSRAVASVDEVAIPPGTVRTLTMNDDSGNPITTRRQNRIKLVIIGDGFQASEAETFFTAAQSKVDSIFSGNGKKGNAPLTQYRALFDVVAVHIPSVDSGSCHPEKHTPCPNTTLGVSFDELGMQRLMGVGPTAYKPFNTIMRTYAPDYDLVMLIANDSTYGGAGGVPAIVSLDSNADDVATHELFGHTFARLGDEYANPYPSYPDIEEPNTTKNGDAATVKWAEWETRDTASMNPGRTDLIVNAPVEGAHYHASGWFRPAKNCKMAAYGQPFCPICAEAVVQAIYKKIKPIDSVEPAAGPVDTSVAGWDLKVLTVPVSNTLQTQWTVDGQAVDLGGSAIFNADSLASAISTYPNIASQASHHVEVTVTDTTSFVSSRGSQGGLMQSKSAWDLK
jgi:hypothetical protein